MVNFIQKFKDLFTQPDKDDHYIIEKWKKETEEADRIKELHLQSRKQDKEAKKAEDATRMPISVPYKREKKGLIKKKGLTVEDFERAKQVKKQKNKTLSSNF